MGEADSGDGGAIRLNRTALGAVWVVMAFIGGLFVVDVIGAIEPDPDNCLAYGYGGGPGGYGCNPILGDAYIEVSQTTGLVDRQQVQVTGRLFNPNAQWGVSQCAVEGVGGDGGSSVENCDLSTSQLTYTNGEGVAEATITVRRFIRTQAGGEIDCANPATPCLLGAAVLGPDLYTAVEAAYLYVEFDPDAPVIPPPTMSIEVDEISAESVTLTVDCTGATSMSLYVDMTQEQAGLAGYGNAYVDRYGETPECASGPTVYELVVESGSRRLGRGTIEYFIYGYASDDYDYANAQLSGDFFQRSTPRPRFITENVPGNDTSIDVIGVVGRGENQRLRVAVDCDRAATYAEVYVEVWQWAGLDRVSGYGNVALDGCPGRVTVDVPIEAQNGRLNSGRTQATASVSLSSYDEGSYYSDWARAAEVVRLRGSIAAELEYVEPNPDSRITIDRVTRSGASGHVTCESPVTVELYAEARQYQGRVIRSIYGPLDDGLIECDGSADFEVTWDPRLQRGTTAVSVQGYAYVLRDSPPTYPTAGPSTTTTTMSAPPVPIEAVGAESAVRPGASIMAEDGEAMLPGGPSLAGSVAADGGYYEYAWSDAQGVTVRIRR